MTRRSRRLESSQASDRIAATAGSGRATRRRLEGSLGPALKAVAEPPELFAENPHNQRR